MGDVFLLMGCLLALVVLIGVFRMRHFFLAVHVAGITDVVCFLYMTLGLIVSFGLWFFSLKLVLMLCIMLITASLTTSILANIAYVCDRAQNGRVDHS